MIDYLIRTMALAVDRRLTEEISGLRVEMHQSIAALRVGMHDGLAGVRQEFRWWFLFWIGQVATIAALLSFMLRSAGR